jgi:hypothetical protein
VNASDFAVCRLRELRDEAGWSQQIVAASMRSHGHNWRQGTVSEVETGVRRLHLDEIAALGHVLEVGRRPD